MCVLHGYVERLDMRWLDHPARLPRWLYRRAARDSSRWSTTQARKRGAGESVGTHGTRRTLQAHVEYLETNRHEKDENAGVTEMYEIYLRYNFTAHRPISAPSNQRAVRAPPRCVRAWFA